MADLILQRIVLDVADMPRSAAFWCAALGYVVTHQDEHFTSLKDPARPERCGMGLQPAEDAKREVSPLHLELFTDDMVREARRLEALGATRVEDWPYPEGECNWIVMRDPDGHEFCVVQRVRQPPSAG